ncbi:molybdate ABC transporter permease subunit [Inhella gelatinilytica]|uniref:Molybdenum transport system permease n=1 Tax=Inhella gelatinilytica TaxID=2795030 RepID=A0A931N9Z5_9BURK|nr:molybdate ABC transporter permease subunit [Inhella gelatinilytica]MBH9551913.1 molybdate ABC transporter permease subunit [Inhella gelatinilytica]
MDWGALKLSLLLALACVAVLLPTGLLLMRRLAASRHRSKPWLEAAMALPLVLPPTVLGFYLLVAFGALQPTWTAWFGHGLAFSFEGLLVASVLANIPFAWLPLQRAFEAIPTELVDAARTCGLSPWQRLWRLELPLAWPGVASSAVMTFAHTLGEFGVVLMVGGNLPGETRTLSIALYDRVQAFDLQAAGQMAALLLLLALATGVLSAWLNRRRAHA